MVSSVVKPQEKPPWGGGRGDVPCSSNSRRRRRRRKGVVWDVALSVVTVLAVVSELGHAAPWWHCPVGRGEAPAGPRQLGAT